jgi:predicted unusual protein kinase regulating ubiquinone biosynthesis (AarF/ABC1/UbiB family)
MGEPADDFNRQAYTREASSLIAATTDQSVGDTQTGTILYELISIGFRHGLKLPAELTLLAKALFNLDAITRSLDPSFNPTEAVRQYTSEIANKRAKREFSPGKIFQMATETSDLLRALPHRLDILTQKMAADDFAVRVDAPELGNLLKGFEKIANRIFTGLVLGGLLVASGMLIAVQRSLGILGFLAAGVIGLYMVITILVTDSRKKKKGG